MPTMYAAADTSATMPEAIILAVTRAPRATGVERSVSRVLFSFSPAIEAAIIWAAMMITRKRTIGMTMVCCMTTLTISWGFPCADVVPTVINDCALMALSLIHISE